MENVVIGYYSNRYLSGNYPRRGKDAREGGAGDTAVSRTLLRLSIE